MVREVTNEHKIDNSFSKEIKDLFIDLSKFMEDLIEPENNHEEMLKLLKKFNFTPVN